jgi:hypothetical protein
VPFCRVAAVGADAAVFAAAGLACERPYAVMRAFAVAYEQASRETSIAH